MPQQALENITASLFINPRESITLYTLQPCPIGPKQASPPSSSSQLAGIICFTNLLALRQSSVRSSCRSCLNGCAHPPPTFMQRRPLLCQWCLLFLLQTMSLLRLLTSSAESNRLRYSALNGTLLSPTLHQSSRNILEWKTQERKGWSRGSRAVKDCHLDMTWLFLYKINFSTDREGPDQAPPLWGISWQ